MNLVGNKIALEYYYFICFKYFAHQRFKIHKQSKSVRRWRQLRVGWRCRYFHRPSIIAHDMVSGCLNQPTSAAHSPGWNLVEVPNAFQLFKKPHSPRQQQQPLSLSQASPWDVFLGWPLDTLKIPRMMA